MGHILADDFVVSGLSKAQYLALLKVLDVKYESANKHEIKVRVYGNTAVLYGRNEIAGRHTGSDSFSSVFDFMDVWVKHAGRWRCVAEFSNRIRDESQEEKNMRPIGPDVKASLVIYFKPGITNQQVEDFWHEVLSRPDPSGKGYYHRNGVGDIGRIAPVQGHEGISMSFFPDATKEERDEVIHDITSSPIVYKVLRDIAPADVKKLD